MPTVAAIIPARYASTRFPGKPLVDLCGKPMIVRVMEQVRKAQKISRVIVATDDTRIQKAVEAARGEAVMTASSLASGTDRVEAASREADCDIVINIQGDEPLIDAALVDQIADLLIDHPNAEMGTLAHKITDPEDLTNPNTAKMALNMNGEALYFSRSPIPFVRNAEKTKDWPHQAVLYKHIGMYVYRKSFLSRFAGWAPTPLEQAECLEQLRALEHGVAIQVGITNYHPVCVDTPEDAERVRTILKQY